MKLCISPLPTVIMNIAGSVLPKRTVRKQTFVLITLYVYIDNIVIHCSYSNNNNMNMNKSIHYIQLDLGGEIGVGRSYIPSLS
jgi:hypothetical protein